MRIKIRFPIPEVLCLVSSLLIPVMADTQTNQDNIMSKIKQGIVSREIAYGLTEPEEVRALIGEPQKALERKSGGMQVLEWDCAGFRIVFAKMRNDPAPFTLREMFFRNETVVIGQHRKIVLRTIDDLRKIDRFWGFSDISLINLDLRDKRELIDVMGFDTLTEWPPRKKLPAEFDPEWLIENAKNPGLGIRSLHGQGIDGRGVGIAICDQPLRLGHGEYTSRLVRYDATGLGDMSPQMHGSPVASIAVGKNIGVASAASLTYFAVPMWERDNRPYINAMEKIVRLNEHLPEKEKIRAVSISTGMFAQQEHFDEWQKVLKKAGDSGIFVVTCDPTALDYGILSLEPGANPDDFQSYTQGMSVSENDELRVPGTNKTLASHRGNDVYTFDRTGGMSWGAPYIAGLAALAYQVNPGINPKSINKALIKTARHTGAGPIVDPGAFIKEVQTYR